MYLVKLSVRELVEFALRGGSIDSTFKGTSLMQEGIKAHQIVQEKQGENYKKELSIKGEINYDKFTFLIDGRCDGLINDHSEITIDEIKSTSKDLMFIDEDYNLAHWAQGKVYAYIYGLNNSIEEISVQITYVNTENYTEKKFKKTFNIGELKEFVDDLLQRYLVLASLKANFNDIRDKTIVSSNFPFDNYRKGQRNLAVMAYKSIKDKKRLFAKAPTGIGKTISTIFPAIKSIGEGNIDKIMYLTAKTITRTVAENTINILRDKGLKIKSITLTAKEKICFNEEVNCNKENCIYADGYYDRVNDAIIEVLSSRDELTRDVIEEYSKKYKLCPFEFTLDLSTLCDVIICDYNYVFDPRVSLKRYGDDETKTCAILVDEAHNLVDRARSMFSASVEKTEVLQCRNTFKNIDNNIYKLLGNINKELLKIRKENEDTSSYDKEKPKELIALITKFVPKAELWLSKNQKINGHKELLDLYFKFNSFIRIYKFYDKRYVTMVERDKLECKVTLFCLDPSKLLKEITKQYKGCIMFSATLSPMEYYKDILGGEEEDYTLQLKSPFERENLEIFIAPISTRYKHRERTYSHICKNISMLLDARPGNYLVFFPSYSYMNKVYENFVESNPNVKTIIQEGEMDEKEREQFLKKFDEENKDVFVGFAVLGGIFSEGIDLKGDRLKGAIIVGVGLPQICLERDIIKNYYDELEKQGYDYSYVYPGMNKIMQAAGRIIRAEQDKGTLLLIDDRLLSDKYRSLMPYEWLHFKVIK